MLSGGVTNSHEACAWVGSDSASQHQQGEDESERREWRQKAQLQCFYLFPYFGDSGNPDSTLLRIFEGLTVFCKRVTKIQTTLGLSPCYGLVKKPEGYTKTSSLHI